MEQGIGYHEDPKNGEGIIRARTTGQLRSWELPRELKALETLNTEFGGADFPGIYILFHKSERKVYVGEAKSIYDRLKTHLIAPEEKLKEWNRALIVNDGRPATQSDFNDTVIRKSLELYLIRLLKANKYSLLSQGEPQKHNPMQKTIVDSLVQELNFFLLKKNIISKLIEEQGQEEILSDELKRILEKNGYDISEWGAYEAKINGEKTFIRPGSKKPKGWQITFRDIFKDSLQKGNGYLLVPRDGILLIPLEEVQRGIQDKTAYTQNTIDIFIVFTEDKVTLSYKNNTIDATKFKILK